MKKLVIILVMIITLSGCIGNATEPKSIDLTVAVVTKNIMSHEVIRYHQIPAVLIAKNRAKLSFQLNGTIDSVLVKMGENVMQGQLLMSLSNPNLAPVLEGDLAQLESINVQINQGKRDLQNLKELRKNNSTSRNAYEHKETELKGFMARKKLILSQIDLAKANIQESKIYAPFDGSIVSLNKQTGEFVSAGAAVIVINQLDSLEAEVNIPPTLLQNLKLNQIITGKYQNKSLEFEVIEYSQVGNSRSHLNKIILQLKTTLKYAIGQEVLLNFPQLYKNVYELPLEAIADDGINNPYIFINENGKAQKLFIKPLYIDDNQLIFNTDKVIEHDVIIKGQSKLSTDTSLVINK